MRVDLLDEMVEGIATALADRVVQALATAPVTTTPASEWRLLTTDEVSTALGRSTRWVREKARSGARCAARTPAHRAYASLSPRWSS